jgi:CheY-like chemotaxis protein
MEEAGVDAHLEIVATGEDAMRRMEKSPDADFVLLDLNLSGSGFDGFDVLKSMAGRREWTDVPVIVVTSSARPDDRTRAQHLGVRHYYRKPADLKGFMGLGADLRRVLEHEG